MSNACLNFNGGSGYSLFATCKGGESAGTVARNTYNSSNNNYGGESAGTVASNTTNSSSSSSCSFSTIA